MKSAISSISPHVVSTIRNKLIKDENSYQADTKNIQLSSLWHHSLRVAHIAHQIARVEGVNTDAALLVGLFHDIGKFDGGKYHEEDIAEEEIAAKIAAQLLVDTPHEHLIGLIQEAITSLYHDTDSFSELGCILYDAERLDKLGYTGISQFFVKNALRGRFLGNDLMIQISRELTYALNSHQTLKTITGKALARKRGKKTSNFYHELIEEWNEIDFRRFSIKEMIIEKTPVILVLPDSCQCGSNMQLNIYAEDSFKCKKVVAEFTCTLCKNGDELSFCLPTMTTTVI